MDGALPRAECQPWDSDVPLVLLFPLFQWRGKGRCSLGEWNPPAPHGTAAALVSLPERWQLSSPFGIWIQLWFLEHSVVLGLCPRCSSSSACGFGAAATPPWAGSQSRRQDPSCGGCSCCLSLSRRRSGPRSNLPSTSRTRGGLDVFASPARQGHFALMLQPEACAACPAVPAISSS